MDYKKFYFYTTVKYIELSTMLRELKPKLNTFVLVLKNADKIILDKIEISELEYEKSGSKYSSYSRSITRNMTIQNEIEDIQNEINEYRTEYNSTIKDILFTDIANELSIDFEAVFTIVKVVLNRSIYINYFSNLKEIGDEYLDIEFVNFEQFYSIDYSICETIAKLILELVENELLLLRLKI